MPCDSSHLRATGTEIRASEIMALKEELKTGKLPEYYGNGYYSEVYGQPNAHNLDDGVRYLCRQLERKKPNEIKGYSLEMQMFWRDHQRADRMRKNEEIKRGKAKKEKTEREELNKDEKSRVLKKLTPRERKILGI